MTCLPATNTSRTAVRDKEKTIALSRSSSAAPAIEGSLRSTVKKSPGRPVPGFPLSKPILSAPLTVAHLKERPRQRRLTQVVPGGQRVAVFSLQPQVILKFASIFQQVDLHLAVSAKETGTCSLK